MSEQIEADDEGGRNDPTSRGRLHERVVNMDRLVKRIAVLVNELHPEVFQHRSDIERLRSAVAQQSAEIQQLRATVGQLQARTFDGRSTTTGG